MKEQILVVDDEQDARDYLAALLEDSGYTVRTAADGRRAMEEVKEERPALILLDLEMPAETGTGFFRKLRDKKELRDIPVIVVSGLAGRNVAVSRRIPVLDKPLDRDRVLAEVRKALGG